MKKLLLLSMAVLVSGSMFGAAAEQKKELSITKTIKPGNKNTYLVKVTAGYIDDFPKNTEIHYAKVNAENPSTTIALKNFRTFKNYRGEQMSNLRELGNKLVGSRRRRFS